jgi:bifunctional DNA-binding transcriptional regulator/antitoxin component of YhaV-PrlF toxin-antitoxin module
MLIEKENVSRPLDSLGRITIPKSLRARLGYTTDTKYEFYVIEHDGKRYVAIRPTEDLKENL